MATLTVSRTGNGTVTSSPAGLTCGATCTFRFAVGSRVNLAAVAAGGSRFSGWNGACQGTATCSVVLNGNLTVGAAFATTTNPAPTLATLAPSTAKVGNGGVTLTVSGGNFAPVSVVRWNGSPRTTTYLSATQLRAAIPAADLARAGTAQVSVVTPSPGGGTSVSRAFTITAAPTVPTNTVRDIILDNARAGVQDRAGGRTFTGQWCRSESPQPYGPDSLHSCGSGVDTYRWTPNVPVPGMYDVYVWMTGRAARSRSVPVTVGHVGGTTTRQFDQTLGGGQWVFHGRYRFYDGPGGYVEISDRNGAAGADAIRLSGPR
jgi:hypothetical protein